MRKNISNIFLWKFVTLEIYIYLCHTITGERYLPAQQIPANSHTAGAGYDDRNTASAAMSGDKGEQEEKAEREEEKGEIIKEHNKKCKPRAEPAKTTTMKRLLIAMSIAAALTACTTNAQNKTDKNNKTMKTIELDKQQFIEKVFDYESNPTTWKYEGTKPAIVDFYATWCRPCKMVAPILEELAEEYGDSIVIYKVDTDRQQELAAAFGIRSIPSLLFIPVQGQPQMVQGAMGKADFRKIIDSVLLGKE